ncbi:MAG: hypothetical protein K8R19_10975, partial [Methanosarcinales archaeon]|nr:hypothetical protein [Methanosarcinales archaeon]
NMSAGFIIGLIISVWVSFLTALLGVVIYKGNVGLIGGYDPNKVVDKEGLAKWVGSHMMLMGIFILMLPILIYFIKVPIIGLWFLGLSIIIVSTIIGSKKFEHK